MANYPTTGDDFIEGDNTDEYLHGGPNSGLGNDLIIGNGGNDTIYGGLQNDTMFGGAGNDEFIINGVDGWDTFNGGGDYDKIIIEDVSEYANYSLLNIDGIAGVEEIVNTHYKDAVIGVRSDQDFRGITLTNIDKIQGSKTGGETIRGSYGNDNIDGRGGNDVLQGDLGDDTLTGGDGNDFFVFAEGHGTNVVTDFTDGEDFIRLFGTTATDINDLSITQTMEGVEFTVDGTNILLAGADLATLSNADFEFV
ncbi:calcium-binding protein [Pseudophaeobacter sp. C1-32P7]|uniref:calcium-binding protein n=1 Tax=Pseudophaeobacter sp. C1-32P7 TaxID=3098142 RepID=UPI0034D72825